MSRGQRASLIAGLILAALYAFAQATSDRVAPYRQSHFFLGGVGALTAAGYLAFARRRPN